MNEKKLVIASITVLSIGILGMIGLFLWISSSVEESKADHYQNDIKEIATSTNDCNHWINYLNDQYTTNRGNDTDFYNYLAHVYEHAKSMNCSPLPSPIKVIQESYHE